MKLCDSCGACFDDNYDLCGFDGGVLHALFPGSRVIGGRYLLEQRVASGAMGVVIRATHLQVGSTIAVKLMRPQQEDAHIALARFQREAQILGQIKHPNAVLVIDFGVDARGQESVPFLAMEYLRGESLLSLLEKKDRLTLEELDRVLGPLCDAVDEAHAVGVIHRDIKPSNVMLEKLRDGSEIVKVLDFGIAKFVERGKRSAHAQTLDAIAEVLADDDEFLDEVVATRKERAVTPMRTVSAEGKPVDHTTDAGFMIGTIPYMAPEQMTGDRVSRRTDVHAVAVLAFQCLSGRLPYDGDDEDIIAAKLSDERPSLRELGVEVDAHLDALLQRAFALDPSERPASVREIAEAVRACLAPSQGDAVAQATSGLESAKRMLDEVERAVCAWAASRSEQEYAHARDRLLALHAPLLRLQEAAARVEPPLAAERRKPLRAARAEMEARVHAVRRALPQAERADEEYGAYLSALWLRLDVGAQAILDAVLSLVEDERTSPGTNPLLPLQLFAQAEQGPAPAEIAERLLGKDPLDAADALEAVFDGAVDVVAHTVGPGRDTAVAAKLVRGLWRHADVILLHELHTTRRGFRVLPFLAGLRDVPEAAHFATLARMLGALELTESLATIDNAEDRRVLARCLLIHPTAAVRVAALDALELPDLWNVIAHPSTPMSVARFLFEHLRTRARAEYLKVFFFCVRDNMRAVATSSELVEALALLQQFFQVSCFHEDMVFEPLLELDRAVRQRAAAIELSMPDEAQYVEKLSAFTAKGQTETLPIEGMADVPLPIQRKLAREGHFLSFFISHTNDRVAKETLPHLLRLEDVTPFLRVTTIHRILLTELAKRRRFFRKEAARLALLQHPKTPAAIARMFVPLVSEDQLRVLSTSKHINPDVRRVISSTLRSG